MGVRQLEEFLGQADQKGFWIFTYANLGGGFIGAFLGNSVLERLAPSITSLKLLGIVLGVLLGVMVTWKVKGHPIYKWALSYGVFILRRYLKLGLGDSAIDAGAYYRARAVKQEPFMIVATREGRPVPVLVHRGSGAGAATDLFDDLLITPAEDRAWGILHGAPNYREYDAGADGVSESTLPSRKGHSAQPSHLPATEEQFDPSFSEWGL